MTGAKRKYTLASLDVGRGESRDELTLDLKASYNSQPIALSGKIGLLHNLFARQCFPLNLSATFSNTTVEIGGAIDDMPNLAGIDLKLNGSGKDLPAVGSIIGHLGLKTPDSQ